jgi:hypothetical protein
MCRFFCVSPSPLPCTAGGRLTANSRKRRSFARWCKSAYRQAHRKDALPRNGGLETGAMQRLFHFALNRR